jgi:hypothetical protein
VAAAFQALSRALERSQIRYVLAVSCDHRVAAGAGRTIGADKLAARLPGRAWQLLTDDELAARAAAAFPAVLAALIEPAGPYRSGPPASPLQRGGREPTDDSALIVGSGQLRTHRVGGARRVPAFAQHLRDNSRAAKVDLERPGEAELPVRPVTCPRVTC